MAIVFDEANVAAYAEALGGLHHADFDKAVKAAVKQCRFFPSIAEIYELATGFQRDRFSKEAAQRQREEIAEWEAEKAARTPEQIAAGEAARRKFRAAIDAEEAKNNAGN